jgi:hypothetical protein
MVRHGEGELAANLGQSAMTRLTQPGHCLGPAQSFLDAFANALGNRLAGIADRAAVGCRKKAVGILSDMRGDRRLSQFHHKVAGGIIALVHNRRDRLWPVSMRSDQRECRQALGMARTAGCHRADDQAVAVLHQRVADEAQPRLFAGSFAERTGIGSMVDACGSFGGALLP